MQNAWVDGVLQDSSLSDCRQLEGHRVAQVYIVYIVHSHGQFFRFILLFKAPVSRQSRRITSTVSMQSIAKYCKVLQCNTILCICNSMQYHRIPGNTSLAEILLFLARFLSSPSFFSSLHPLQFTCKPGAQAEAVSLSPCPIAS